VGSREEMVALAWEMELVTPKDIRLYNKRKKKACRFPNGRWWSGTATDFILIDN